VQQSGSPNLAALDRRATKHLSHAACVRGDALRVVRSESTLGVDDVGQRERRPIELILVGDPAALGRLRSVHAAAPIAATCVQRFPETAIVSQLGQQVREFWVEPQLASSAGHVQRLDQTVLGGEDFYGLNQAEDAGQQGNLLAAQTVWVAGAVKVLVQVLYRRTTATGKSEQLRDLGGAVRQIRGHRVGRLLHLAHQPQRLLQALERRALSNVLQCVQCTTQRAGQAVDMPVAAHARVGLAQHKQVVGDGRRTAGVLDERGIVEIGHGPRIEPEHLAQFHRDQATALRVTGRLTFVEVQRFGKRNDEIRHPDLDPRVEGRHTAQQSIVR